MNECIPALWKTTAVYNMFQKSEPIPFFFFFKYGVHPSNLRGINWELPQLMPAELEILSNVTDLGQGQHQAKNLIPCNKLENIWLLQTSTDSSTKNKPSFPHPNISLAFG